MKKLNINKQQILDVVKSIIIAVIASLLFVLIFAIIVNFVEISSKPIMIVNQVIKILSLAIGCIIGFKNNRQGALKGGITGLLFTFLSIFIFGLISHSVTFDAMRLVDIALGIVAGVISGIISVNLKRKA